MDNQAAQLQEKTLAMNEALLLGSLRQHELTEAAEKLNEQLRAEIAERNLAEDRIRESEERYRNLFNSMDEGYCIIEVLFDAHQKAIDYRFLDTNPSFEKQCGLQNMTGRRMRETHPDHEEYWFETYGKVALTGEPVRFVNEAKTLGGRWFDLNAFKIGGPESRKVAVLFKDITERKQIESNLNNAMAVAEKANQAKSEFLSNMSHELRSPLNAILGFAQLLESDPAPQTARQKENVGHILQAGWYLLDLINEILDLALVESGTLTLSPEPMSLADVLLECQTMMEPQAEKAHIRMSFPTLEAPVFVFADRTRLKQILVNLLSNAIKYNKIGGTVSVECNEVSAERTRICIRDTGEGMSSDQLAQLFQPFNRLGKEASGEEGTGIGLVMTKRLVEMMGGTIGMESTVGVGSVFWFELVRAKGSSRVTTAHVDSVQVSPDVAARTLLCVEDNPANLKLVEQLIARRSHTYLLKATDATIGIELAREHQPAVILMDINLPGLSGIAALKILRDDRLTRHIPVIAISANAMSHDIERGLAAGFFRYLTKPIKVQAFMTALDAALEVSNLPRPELDATLLSGVSR